MDTSKQTDLALLVEVLSRIHAGQTEVEIRLQRIFEALSEIDLTLQAIVAYQD